MVMDDAILRLTDSETPLLEVRTLSHHLVAGFQDIGAKSMIWRICSAASGGWYL